MSLTLTDLPADILKRVGTYLAKPIEHEQLRVLGQLQTLRKDYLISIEDTDINHYPTKDLELFGNAKNEIAKSMPSSQSRLTTNLILINREIYDVSTKKSSLSPSCIPQIEDVIECTKALQEIPDPLNPRKRHNALLFAWFAGIATFAVTLPMICLATEDTSTRLIASGVALTLASLSTYLYFLPSPTDQKALAAKIREQAKLLENLLLTPARITHFNTATTFIGAGAAAGSSIDALRLSSLTHRRREAHGATPESTSLHS